MSPAQLITFVEVLDTYLLVLVHHNHPRKAKSLASTPHGATQVRSGFAASQGIAGLPSTNAEPRQAIVGCFKLSSHDAQSILKTFTQVAVCLYEHLR